MTRVLYWNIQNFSLNKIYNNSKEPDLLNESIDRLMHIVHEVMKPHEPDIFVIVELYRRIRDTEIEGTVINEDMPVGVGVQWLLSVIREAFGNHWCLVPPINLGTWGEREAVAVFYNYQKLQFAGPYIWYLDGKNNMKRAQPANTNSQLVLYNYPDIWKNGMPNPDNPIKELRLERKSKVKNIGGELLPFPEYQCAGQWAYFNGDPLIPFPLTDKVKNRIGFPSRSPNTTHRAPFYTKFMDLANPGRIINLFTIHTSPGETADDAVKKLAFVPEIQSSNANEVSVVIGDFNVDTFDPMSLECYQGLERLGYKMQLDSRDPSLNNNNSPIQMDRQPYCITHLLPVDKATPFNNTGVVTDAQHNVYPRYGYMGSMGGLNFQTPVTSGALDNVFTKYGTALKAPNPNNITVVNTIVGTPYDKVKPTSPNITPELIGGQSYESTLSQEIPGPSTTNPQGGVVQNPLYLNLLGFWKNFGRIRSTSDHLALLIDI